MNNEQNWLSVVPSIISALSGLGGVILGGWLTTARERNKEKIRTKKESVYLSALVLAHLNQFINNCVAIAFDDGTEEGSPAGKDKVFYAPTTKTPTFNPLDLDVDWKVLPEALMFEILTMPEKFRHLENNLAGIYQFDSPPDYCDFFWSRRQRYAMIALDTLNICNKLRTFVERPSETQSSDIDWNIQSEMERIIAEVDEQRDAYEAKIKGTG